MTSAMLRIQNDLKEINRDDFNKNIAYAKLQDGHPLVVKASVIGPRSTTYEGTIFEVKIQFSDNYPFSSPTITVMAEANHLDALLVGRLTTSFFQNNWTPTYTIKDILNLILGLISDDLEQIALAYEVEHLYIQ